MSCNIINKFVDLKLWFLYNHHHNDKKFYKEKKCSSFEFILFLKALASSVVRKVILYGKKPMQLFGNDEPLNLMKLWEAALKRCSYEKVF